MWDVVQAHCFQKTELSYYAFVLGEQPRKPSRERRRGVCEAGAAREYGSADTVLILA
jgi:hypothetical protein